VHIKPIQQVSTDLMNIIIRIVIINKLHLTKISPGHISHFLQTSLKGIPPTEDLRIFKRETGLSNLDNDSAEVSVATKQVPDGLVNAYMNHVFNAIRDVTSRIASFLRKTYLEVKPETTFSFKRLARAFQTKKDFLISLSPQLRDSVLNPETLVSTYSLFVKI